jgi:dephospho-CoA kinase
VHLFGLTGGIASGKSTVAARLRAHGVPVIDADEVAREVVMPGSEGLAAVVEAFGRGVVAADGTLDRKGLAAIVFGDDARRGELNAILHPRISRRTMERSAELAARGEALACYEAALIVENGAAGIFRPLVVVVCPEAEQLARLRARDGVTHDEAGARIRAQMPLAEKVRAADHVIDTSGPIEVSRGRTDDVLAAILLKLGIDPARYALAQRPG